MTFVVRMALREIRASWQRLLFFFICIAIGVGSIVALRSLIQSVRVALAGEARTLLGADVLVASNRPWTPMVLETLEAEQRAGRITARLEAAEIPTMVRPADPSKPSARMVELRAVGVKHILKKLSLDKIAFVVNHQRPPPAAVRRVI